MDWPAQRQRLKKGTGTSWGRCLAGARGVGLGAGPLFQRTARCVLLPAAVLWLGGCGEDARLADRRIPHIVVETVSDQGVELGPQASPQDVVYVLLRAIRDDVLAGADREARRAALLRQMGVCDPDYIHELYKNVMGPRAVYSRDEWVYKKVRLWAPTLAYYVDSFDVDPGTAKERMEAGEAGETAHVDFPARDPTGQPGADVVVRVWLHKHQTGNWRVFHVGFAKKRPRAPSTAPRATGPSDEPRSAPDATPDA